MGHSLEKVELHPISVKSIIKGHPWVTKDEFSLKFPARETFLAGIDRRKNTFCVLLNDPTHPQIKARVLKTLTPTTEPILFAKKFFMNIVEEKLEKSYNKNQKLGQERENYYLCFGESDGLPGLFIQKLGPHILIQYYCFTWEKFTMELAKMIRRHVPHIKSIHLQKRSPGETSPVNHLWGESITEFSISEFNIKYHLNFGQNDVGIYTDMAASRKKLRPLLKDSKSTLNLYAYTGAYSLNALTCDDSNVYSVDLSANYLEHLEDNISLNPQLCGNHYSICESVNSAVDEFTKSKKSFDLIISDPPSFSSDGKKKSRAAEYYKTLLPKLIKLTEAGGHIVAFLNTHQINARKFYAEIEKIIEKSEREIEIMDKLILGEDCSSYQAFPEGNYLKGLVLKIK